MQKVIKLRDNGSKRVSVMLSSKSIVEQNHKKAVNINTIVAKARKGQYVPPSRGEPMYGDFTNADDYLGCQLRVMHAQEMFMELPSTIRNRFRNDPAELIEFCNDPENEQEARELGILPKAELVSATLAEEPEPKTEPPEESL